ncbi:hypothetical protein JS561_03060 [Salmonella enterica subsp. enterica serovar Infantis]|nr:hypothetical protein JS561_03060 [Salmonella enterica subsp. enterica serovar Infantis]
MTVGSFGIGAKDGAYAFEVNDFGAVQVAMSGSGLRTYRNNGFLGDGDQSIAQYSPTIWLGDTGHHYRCRIALRENCGGIR